MTLLAASPREVISCTRLRASDGHDAHDGAAAQETHSGSLRRVPQRTQGGERSDQEVAVRHANLQAALPRLQALAVEGQCAQELLGEEAVLSERDDLVTSEGLFSLPLRDKAGEEVARRSGHCEWDLAGHH